MCTGLVGVLKYRFIAKEKKKHIQSWFRSEPNRSQQRMDYVTATLESDVMYTARFIIGIVSAKKGPNACFFKILILYS